MSIVPQSSSMIQSPLLIAQITDIHLFADFHQDLLGMPTTDSFQALLKHLSGLSPRPDLLLLTGDLSQDGTPRSYDHLQALLTPLGIPVYWLPGNHDAELEEMEQSLTHPLFFPDRSFGAGGWRFVLLDSQEIGCVHGSLSSQELNRLDRDLSQHSEQPTIVALHHPPFEMHSDWLDASTLQNPEALFEVLDRYAQVKLVLFGHIHQEFYRQRCGVTYLGTPSTCIQFEPRSRDFSIDSQKPGFRLLDLHPNGVWNTQVKRIAYSHQLDLAAVGY